MFLPSMLLSWIQVGQVYRFLDWSLTKWKLLTNTAQYFLPTQIFSGPLLIPCLPKPWMNATQVSLFAAEYLLVANISYPHQLCVWQPVYGVIIDMWKHLTKSYKSCLAYYSYIQNRYYSGLWLNLGLDQLYWNLDNSSLRSGLEIETQ